MISLAPADPVWTLPRSYVQRYLLLVLAHVLLGLAMRFDSKLATAHALLTLGWGIKLAFGKNVAKAAYLVAYITGAEVLWRMSNGSPVWEFGKYSCILILSLSLYRHGRSKPPVWIVAYLLLLLPGILVPLVEFQWQARKDISFSISGVLLFAVAATFFRGLRVSPQEFAKWCLALSLPTVGILASAMYAAVTAEAIVFHTESNATISGGFGPNQVSSVLGLAGVCVMLVAALYFRGHPNRRFIFGSIAILLLGYSVATFSRSGIVLAIGSCLGGASLALRDPRVRHTMIAFIVMVIVLTITVLRPQLDKISGGKLTARYSAVELTGRGRIAAEEFKAWLEHPILGIGVGQVKYWHERRSGHRTAAHTEYARLMAEHGTPGLLLIALVLGMLISHSLTIQAPLARGLTAIFVIWAGLFMSVNAMRLAAPSICLAFGFCRLFPPVQLQPCRSSS